MPVFLSFMPPLPVAAFLTVTSQQMSLGRVIRGHLCTDSLGTQAGSASACVHAESRLTVLLLPPTENHPPHTFMIACQLIAGIIAVDYPRPSACSSLYYIMRILVCLFRRLQ